MNFKKQKKNEFDYETWIEKAGAGRIYSFEIKGRHGWKALYLKEVDADEITLNFWQEVYDENNILREIHEKYPVDKGHKKL